jgi:type VII secretion integral membrane protein EccD
VAWQAALALCGVQLLAAAGWVRSTSDLATGLVLVLTSAGSAAAAGAAWSMTPHAPGADPLARAVLAAGLPAAVALAAGIAVLAGPRQRLSWLCGPVTVGLLMVLCAGLAWVVGLHRVQLAAVLVLVSLASRSLVPMLAFRLAGLRTPMLPATAEDIQHGVEPEPAAQVLDRAARADLAMTMMHTGFGLGSAAASIWLASAPGWAAWSTAVAASLAQLLVARSMTSAWQRMAVGLPGGTGLVAAVLAFPAGAAVTWHLLAVAGLIALAATSVSIGRSIPDRPLIPVWGRVGDLLLTLTSGLVVPLALGACGVYGLVRGGGG